MWFKNLYIYKLQQAFQLTAEALHEKLAARPFIGCLKDQRESSGWDKPLGKETESFTHATNGFIWITMAHQERMLPSSVVKEELDKRVNEIQERESRKLSSREKKDMREQVEFELLPQAFTRTKHLDAWIDPKGMWLVINTSSATQAERLTALLRKCIDTLPIAAPETSASPSFTMTHWLTEGVLPPNFEFGEACELRSQGDDQSVAVFKKHELLTDEVKLNLASGKLVSKLMLTWDSRLSFALTDNLQIKGLKFLDVFDEQLNEQDPQSYAERKDIEFTLMTGEVSRLLDDLMAALENLGASGARYLCEKSPC